MKMRFFLFLVALAASRPLLAEESLTKVLSADSWQEVDALSPAQLIGILNTSSDAAARAKAAEFLGRLGVASAFNPLRNALHDNNSHVRDSVAWALGRLGNSGAVPVLSDVLLTDPDARVRQSAAGSLGRVHEGLVLPALVQAMEKDSNTDVRIQSAFAIQNIASNDAIQAVKKARKSESNEWVKNWEGRALGQMDYPNRVRQTVLDNFKKLEGSNPAQKAEAAKYIGINAYAARSWGVTQTQTIASSLVKAAGDPDPNVRKAAVYALGQIGDWKALIPLKKLSLNDPDTAVRNEAAYALDTFRQFRMSPRQQVTSPLP